MRLDDLFRVTDDFTLPNGKVVPMRVLSDIELKIRADAAQDAAVSVVYQVNDKDSEFYKRNVLPLATSGESSLVAFLLTTRLRDIERDVYRSIKPQVIAIPDDAEDDEIEKIELQRNEEEDRVHKERSETIKKRVDKFHKDLQTLDRDELVSRAEMSVSTPFTIDARRRAHILWTVHLSTDRLFTVEQLEGMDPRVVVAMYDKYQEIDRVDPFGLH